MKNKPTRIFIFFFAILLGTIAVGSFNFLFVEPLIIPDPCYYHNHETTPVFDVFYTIAASEGYHPFPSTFNLTFTLIAGVILGYFIGKKALQTLWNS